MPEQDTDRLLSAPPVVVVEPRSGEPDIKRFSALDINEEIDKIVARLKPDQHVTGVAAVTQDGLHFALVGKLKPKFPGDWTWTVYADHAMSKPALKNLKWGAAICWTD